MSDTDPGDGRSECEWCGKWVWLVIHSCNLSSRCFSIHFRWASLVTRGTGRLWTASMGLHGVPVTEAAIRIAREFYAIARPSLARDVPWEQASPLVTEHYEQRARALLDEATTCRTSPRTARGGSRPTIPVSDYRPPSTPPARSLMTDPGRRERNDSEETP